MQPRTRRRALDAAAELTVARLAERGLTTEDRVAAAEPPQDRPDPDARVGRPAQGADRRAARRGGATACIDAGAGRACSRSSTSRRRPHARRASPIPRVTSDAKHVEIGLTDKSDSATLDAARPVDARHRAGPRARGGDEFGRLGGLPGQRLAHARRDRRARATAVSVGPEPSGVPARRDAPAVAGPTRSSSSSDEQLARARRTRAAVRRRAARGGSVVVDGIDPEHEARRRGALDSCRRRGSAPTERPYCVHPAASPRRARVPASTTETDPRPNCSLAPLVASLGRWSCRTGADVRRVLDLHTGMLREDVTGPVSVRSVRFIADGARPGRGAPGDDDRRRTRVSPLEPFGGAGAQVDVGRRDDHGRGMVRGRVPTASIAAAARQDVGTRARIDSRVLDRFSRDRDERHRRCRAGAGTRQVDEQHRRGFEAALIEHRADVGAPLGRRRHRDRGRRPRCSRRCAFALYPPDGAAAAGDEAAVGARGLTGRGYRGPRVLGRRRVRAPVPRRNPPGRAARAMLEYRVRRFPAAREAAAAQRLARGADSRGSRRATGGT